MMANHEVTVRGKTDRLLAASIRVAVLEPGTASANRRVRRGSMKLTLEGADGCQAVTLPPGECARLARSLTDGDPGADLCIAVDKAMGEMASDRNGQAYQTLAEALAAAPAVWRKGLLENESVASRGPHPLAGGS